MGGRSNFLDKAHAAGTVINTLQLRSQGKSITALSRQLDFNSRALTHVSSQLEGIGELAVMNLVALSELDSKLVAIGKHFHAIEVREETWSSMRDRLIELGDSLEEIEQQFEDFPVYSMFCLEFLEALANKNGIEKENFRYRDDKVDVHKFRKQIIATKRDFKNSLRELKLITKLRNFKSLLQEYHDKSEELAKKRDKISSHVNQLEKGEVPDPRKPESDNFLEQLDKKISDADKAITRNKNELVELEIEKKKGWSNYIEERQNTASHQFLRSIKVDLNDMYDPISNWNDGLVIELKKDAWKVQHREDRRSGVRCAAYEQKGSLRRGWVYKKCTRRVKRHYSYCSHHQSQGGHGNDGGAKPWRNAEWFGINEVIRAEQRAGEKLELACEAIDEKIAGKKRTIRNAIERHPKELNKKYKRKQGYLQKLVNATKKAEELSDRLDVIENEISPHLPLDISPSDLQS